MPISKTALATLSGISVRPKSDGDGEARDSVRLLAGLGVDGDHHATRAASDPSYCKNNRQVTLISSHDLATASEVAGRPLGATDLLRNLVLDCDGELESLIGREFTIGTARLRGTELCPPCSFIESRTAPGVCKALAGRGGICAEVLADGVVKLGDQIVAL